MNTPIGALRFASRLALRGKRVTGTTTTLDMARLVDFYERIWTDAARTLGAEITQLERGIWRVERGDHRTLIHNYIVQMDDPVILHVAGNKPLCHRLLRDEGVAVPEHQVYTIAELHKAHAFMARRAGARFVVKPAAGTSGARGVTTEVRTFRECRAASALASLYGDRLLVERWIPGESYRLLFLDGSLIHASRRRGRRATGDGVSTVEALANPQAPAEPAGLARSPQSAHDIAETLAVQGLRAGSVPANHQRILIESDWSPGRGKTEIRTVFDEDATAEIGAELRAEAARAVAAIGSRFAGVDIITCNPAVALERSGGVVNEINTTPGLHHHYDLAGGSSAGDPATRVLARLLMASEGDAGVAAAARGPVANASSTS